MTRRPDLIAFPKSLGGVANNGSTATPQGVQVHRSIVLVDRRTAVDPKAINIVVFKVAEAYAGNGGNVVEATDDLPAADFASVGSVDGSSPVGQELQVVQPQPGLKSSVTVSIRTKGRWARPPLRRC